LAFIYAQPAGDIPRARQIYTDVATRFAARPLGYIGQVNVLDIRLRFDRLPFADYLTEIDRLIVRAQGPSLATLGAGRRGTVQPSSELTHKEQREVLTFLYTAASGRMSYRPTAEQTTDLLRRSLNIQTFVNDAFPTLVGAQAAESMRHDVYKLQGQLDSYGGAPADQRAPRITKAKPEGNAGPRSDVVARLNDGDVSETQVNLTSLKVTLDGTDITSQLQLRSRTSRKVKPGTPFQKIKVRYCPLQPLAAGSHVVVLNVSDLAGNPAEHSWSFSVNPKQHDHRDDETGDDRCDEEPDDSDD